MVRGVSWELERPSVAPSLRGLGSRPVYNRHNGKWRVAARESEGVVVPLEGAGQHNPAEREGPLLHRRACWGERIGECPHAG
jgi:hypothetical protein